jgi:hypothetical protein
MNPNTTGGRPQIIKNGTINKNRRDFLKTAALVGGSALVTGVPLVSYFTAPALSKSTGKWVDFGPVEDLEPGGVSMLSYEFLIKDGWLVLPQRGIVWANLIGLHPSELQRHMAGRDPGFRMSLPCRPF